METKDFEIVKKDCSTNEKVVKPFTQKFRSVYPTYELDKKINKLVETGTRDVQKEINSHRECALDLMLDKFLDREKEFKQQYDVVDGDGVVEYKSSTLDLAELGDALELADIYREKYGLPLSSTPQEVFSYVKQKELEINAKIKSLQEKESEVMDNA